MAERHVTIPLMVRTEDIQFVEDDNDTVSDNEHSTDISRARSKVHNSNIYNEISYKDTKVDYLDIPKLSLSRSTSTESSGAASPMLERKSSARKKHGHDYEKLSVTSTGSKKSTVERIAESAFFRRRLDTTYDKKEHKSEEDENVLEVLRQVVRKCTNDDPIKRPSSRDILELFSSLSEKS